MHVFASKIVITFVAVLVAVGLSAEPVAQPAEPVFAIVPLAKITPGRGVFTLRATTPIVTDAVLRSRGRQLASLPAPATGFNLAVRVRATPKVPHIALRQQRSLAKVLGEEGYRLDVTPRAITIRAASPTGVSYGIQTLRQLFPPAIFREARLDGISWQAPAVSIEDVPPPSWASRRCRRR